MASQPRNTLALSWLSWLHRSVPAACDCKRTNPVEINKDKNDVCIKHLQVFITRNCARILGVNKMKVCILLVGLINQVTPLLLYRAKNCKNKMWLRSRWFIYRPLSAFYTHTHTHTHTSAPSTKTLQGGTLSATPATTISNLATSSTDYSISSASAATSSKENSTNSIATKIITPSSTTRSTTTPFEVTNTVKVTSCVCNHATGECVARDTAGAWPNKTLDICFFTPSYASMDVVGIQSLDATYYKTKTKVRCVATKY